MKHYQERGFRILEFKQNTFDIIGDVHGCYDELIELVHKLGYHKRKNAYYHPQGRRLISVGDVADKGPKNLDCLNFWIDQTNFAGALWVHGNHCNKLYRYFLGNKVMVAHGLENTVDEINNLPPEEKAVFRRRFMQCYESQCFYYILDKRKLIVVHGGLREESIGKFSSRIRAVCLYGETTGNFHDNGKPERIDWAADYKGKQFIVYGHTVAESPDITNNTVDIDQGCVHGGFLTAMRYPEYEFVQVRGKEYMPYSGNGSVPL